MCTLLCVILLSEKSLRQPGRTTTGKRAAQELGRWLAVSLLASLAAGCIQLPADVAAELSEPDASVNSHYRLRSEHRRDPKRPDDAPGDQQ